MQEISDCVYYVYTHTDPRTDEIVYVGKGCNGRAWDVTRCRNDHPEHQLWMLELIKEGFVPSDWVNIIHRQCTEDYALTCEKSFLHTHGTTRFNRQSGERNYQAKLTDKQAQDIFMRLALGQKAYDLAAEYGVSPAAIYMIGNRKQWKAATACLI